MAHSAGNSLHRGLVEVEDVKRPDAPAVVVAVLPVVHTVLPPAGVSSPPLTGDVVVIQPPFGGSESVGMAALVIDIFRSHSKIQYPSERDPADYDGPAGIVAGGRARRSKVDSVAGEIAAADIPYSRESS